MDDPEISDGVSENEYSDHEQEVEKEDDDNTAMAEQKPRTDTEGNGKAGGSVTAPKPKLDPKDPLRPRRKKARRACFACQRAHLTCGKFPLLVSLQLCLPQRAIASIRHIAMTNSPM